MQFIESSVVGLRSAVLTLENRAGSLRFILFPMVHVGERSFYREVADRLRGCALIVAEGGPAGIAPVQERMARIRLDDLVDETAALDLEALGIPIIWEYVPRPPRTRAERATAVAGDTLGAIAGRLLGRYGNPLRVPSIDEVDEHDDRWLDGGRVDRWLRDTVIHRRDERLATVLTEIHGKLSGKPVAVAVVYGAAHMTSVVDHLRGEFGYFVRDAEWLTVRNAPC